jgi:hypothetical protein
VSSTLQTRIELIKIGFPSLSLTLILSLSKFLAFRDTDGFKKKGATQKNPFSLRDPLYAPKSRNTLELLGLIVNRPPEINKKSSKDNTPSRGCSLAKKNEYASKQQRSHGKKHVAVHNLNVSFLFHDSDIKMIL